MSEHIVDCTITKVYEAKNKEGEPIEGKGDYGPWKLYTFCTDKTAKDKFNFMWGGKKPIPTEGLKVKHIEYDEEKTGKYTNLNVKKLELPDKSTPEAMPNVKEDMGSISKAAPNTEVSYWVRYMTDIAIAILNNGGSLTTADFEGIARQIGKAGLIMMNASMDNGNGQNTSSEPHNAPQDESEPESKGKDKTKVSKGNGGPSKIICDNDDEAGHKGIEVIPMYCKTQCKLKETCATAKQLREME